MKQNKYITTFQNFNPCIETQEIQSFIKKISNKKLTKDEQIKALLFLHSSIDLTSLSGSDTKNSIISLVEKVNQHKSLHPTIPNVAAICVYPLQVAVVKEYLKEKEVKIATVTGGFPASQTFDEIKYAETSLAVHKGAQEIDIVLNRNHFLAEDFTKTSLEIEEQKCAAKTSLLKVILETAMLKSNENIRRAALIALFSGADFIKTSTGKEGEGASLEAVFTICLVLKEYYEKYQKRIGIKISGGVRSPEQALSYYILVKEILGEEWLSPSLFRIGASSLSDAIIQEINQLKS